MKTRKTYGSGNYYKKILLWMITISLFLISIFSTVSYYKTKEIISENLYTSNKMNLNQIAINFNYIDDIVNNICFTLFFNPSVQSIMYSNDVANNDLYDELNRIRMNVLAINPYIKAVYIYNNRTRTIYSTYGNMEVKDSELSGYLKTVSNIPPAKPILRKTSYGTGYGEVRNKEIFSYFLYDFKDKDNVLDGALIIDVSTEWVLQNLKSISLVDDSKSDEVFLLNSKGQVVNGEKYNTTQIDSLKSVYFSQIKNVAPSNKTSGFFQSKIGSTNYLITYMSIEKTGWVLLKIQPSAEIFESIARLQYTFIIITLIFLGLTLLSSVFATKRIYNPIGRLVRQVASLETDKPVNTDFKDEILFLNNYYIQYNEELRKIKGNRHLELETIKNYFLRRLFLDSFSLNEEDINIARQDYGLPIQNEGLFVVCIFKIDDFKLFHEVHNYDDRELYKFALINIFSEIIGKSFDSVTVDMKSKHIAMLIDIKSKENVFKHELKELIKSAQKSFKEFYNISISAAFSETFDDLKKVTLAYYEALDYSIYKFVFGRMCIIDHESVKENMENIQSDYSMSLESKLKEAIKLENFESAEKVLLNIFDEISKLNYNNIMLSITFMINTIKTTANDVNSSKLKLAYVDFNTLTSSIFDTETIEDFHAKVSEILKNVLGKDANKEDHRMTLLVEVIKDMIRANYCNQDICLQQIASNLNMSPKYLSSIFRMSADISIADYINELRMNKALELLDSTRLSVGKVAKKLGIENESYFYTLFKKRYGITPREYRLNKIINKCGWLSG